jgi:hypothetical protein
MTSFPRFQAAFRADCAKEFKVSSVSQKAMRILLSIAVVILSRSSSAESFPTITKLANVTDDGFASGGDSRIANTAIFFERALGVNGLNAEFRADLLEEEFVAGTNAQGATDFVRHGDLTFAGDAGLFREG